MAGSPELAAALSQPLASPPSQGLDAAALGLDQLTDAPLVIEEDKKKAKRESKPPKPPKMKSPKSKKKRDSIMEEQRSGKKCFFRRDTPNRHKL